MPGNSTPEGFTPDSQFVDQLLRQLGLHLKKLAEQLKEKRLPPDLLQYLMDHNHSSIRQEPIRYSPPPPRKAGATSNNLHAGRIRIHRPAPVQRDTRPVRQLAEEALKRIGGSMDRLLEPLADPQTRDHLSRRFKAQTHDLGAGLGGIAGALTGALSGAHTPGTHSGTKGASADLRVLLKVMGALGGASDKAQKELEHSLSAVLSVVVSGGPGDTGGAGKAGSANDAPGTGGLASAAAPSSSSSLRRILIGLSDLSNGSPLQASFAGTPPFVPPAPPAPAGGGAGASKVDLGISVSGVSLAAHGLKESLLKEVEDRQRYELGRLVDNANKGVR